MGEPQRKYHLMSIYGITVDEYDALLKAQGGVCAICGKPPKTRRLGVDHDHKTGVVRGLLCYFCNHRLLGGVKDDVEKLRAAVKYLDNPPAVPVIGARQAPGRKRKRRRKK